MVSLETWQTLSLLDSLNSCFFRTGLPLNCGLDIVCLMRRRRRCAGPARFVFHDLIMVPSSCYYYYRWWRSLPSRTNLHLLCLTFSLLFLSRPSFTHLPENSYVFFFALTVPSMHAIYISQFRFSIAISRRHIIKSRLACIRRMD